MFFKAILKCLVFLETNRLEILDHVPRDLTILYLEIVDSKHKQVGGCLQNLCQSVAIYQKYVLFWYLTKGVSYNNLQKSLTKRSFT